MKHILVLGSEGFIGRHVIKAALLQGYLVYGVDITDKKPVTYNYEKLSLLSSDIELFYRHIHLMSLLTVPGAAMWLFLFNIHLQILI